MTEGRADKRHEFLLIEHASLQEKIHRDASDLYRTETVVPLAIAVVYAWLYGGESSIRDVPGWFWWVPVLTAVFGAWRHYLRYASLWGYHEYLRGIEREIYGRAPKDGDDICYGWEVYWLGSVHPTHKAGLWRVTAHALMRIVFWALLIMGTISLAVHETLHWI